MQQNITVKTKNALEKTVKFYRAAGYDLVTYGKKLAELENTDNFIVIEIKRG